MNFFVLMFLPLCRGFIFSGATAPMGFWDPLDLSKRVDIGHLAFLREAELKHSRWSMLSMITIPMIESKTHYPSINEFDTLPTELKVCIFVLIGFGEFSTLIKGWEDPFYIEAYYPYVFLNQTKVFKLIPNYQPGDVGFGVIERLDYIEHDTINNLELNHGRFAMISSIIVIILEKLYNIPLFATASLDLI